MSKLKQYLRLTNTSKEQTTVLLSPSKAVYTTVDWP